MYCPECAAQNSNDAKFCRVCGTDLVLVAQAMTGRLPSRKKTRAVGCDGDEKQPQQKMAKSITNGFMGLGFVVVALSLMLTGEGWGVYMFIPGFMFIGTGVAGFLSARLLQQTALGDGSQASRAARSSPRTGELAPPDGYVNPEASQRVYGDLPAPPPSVTEGTTRMMDPAVRQRAGD